MLHNAMKRWLYMTFNEFQQKLIPFFEQRGWVLSCCPKCNNAFFHKSNSIFICNSIDCISHVSIPGIKKKSLSYEALTSHMDDFFTSLGYKKRIFPNIKNPNNDTAFIVAAVQQYNYSLYNNHAINEERIYSPQPCIRLKELSQSQLESGFLHSFINASTLKINASFEDYCYYLDHWISLLSTIGIHASKLYIMISKTPATICDLYDGWNIDFIYNGLELGHCSFFHTVLSKTKKYTGIDCGFCVERLLWVVNGDFFWKNLLPPDTANMHIQSHISDDLLRTIVLILMSNIRPGSKNDKYQLKKLLLSFNQSEQRWALIDYNFTHFYNYWGKYIPQRLTLQESKTIFYSFLRKEYLYNETTGVDNLCSSG